MNSEQEPKKIVSRRDFLKGSVITAAGLALSGGVLAGCKPTVVDDSEAMSSAVIPTEADPIPPVPPPATWDYSADRES